MKLKVCILPFLTMALFTSCSPAQSEYSNKNTSSEYEINANLLISWDDCLNQKESHYLVFFYSKSCQHCHQIMGDVLSFSESNIVYGALILQTSLDGEKWVTINTTVNITDNKTFGKDQINNVQLSNDIDKTIGASKTDELFIVGTPTLLEIEDGYVKANVPGKEDCLSLLNELRLNNI